MCTHIHICIYKYIYTHFTDLIYLFIYLYLYRWIDRSISPLFKVGNLYLPRHSPNIFFSSQTAPQRQIGTSVLFSLHNHCILTC